MVTKLVSVLLVACPRGRAKAPRRVSAKPLAETVHDFDRCQMSLPELVHSLVKLFRFFARDPSALPKIVVIDKCGGGTFSATYLL